MAGDAVSPGEAWRLASVLVLLASSLLILGARSPAGTSFLIAAIGVAAAITIQKCDLRVPTARYAAVLLTLPALALIPSVPRLAAGALAMPVQSALTMLMLAVAYVLFFVICWGATATRRGREAVVVILVLIGLSEAAYGVLNLLSGNENLLLYKRWAYQDSATGTLVNRNHFAYLLELTIPLAVVVAGRARRLPSGGRIETRENAARGTLWMLAASCMLLALLLSRSRMGMASLMAATILVLLLFRMLRPAPGTTAARSVDRRAIPLMIGITLFFLAGAGADIAFERFGTAAGDLQGGRLPIWSETLRMIQASPLSGSGLGSYEHLISSHRPNPVPTPAAHAHNEYLEVLAENGVFGVAVVLLWIVLFLRRLLRTLRLPMDPARLHVVLATSVGITSIILHSAMDFGLRIPAIALTLIAVVVLYLRFSADAAVSSLEQR